MGAWRSTTALAAGLAVLMPAIQSGVDGKHLFETSASASPRQETAVDIEGEHEPMPGRSKRAVHAAVVPSEPIEEDEAFPLAAPIAFGWGAFTGFHPSSGPRELVLSFDDGPDLKFTPLVLDELERRGLKAIFFVTGHRVVGDRAEDLARRELLRKITAHGHLVGNHTMSHRDLCRYPTELASEIDANAEVIAGATGVRPMLFRAPYGVRCRALEIALAERELVSVGWNLDPQDWRNPTSEEILAYLEAKLAKLSGRGILLLHDTHPASVYALGPLLDWIARENRRAVSEHRPPIQFRDYSVFLPERDVPRTAIAAVVERMARGLPAAPRLLARR